MKRISMVGFCLAAVFALSAMAATSATATGYDWTVNEVPLKAGETKKVAFESTSVATLKVPGLGFAVVCQHFSGTKTIVGGELGTAKAAKSTMVGCSVEGEPGTLVSGPYGPEEAGTLVTHGRVPELLIHSFSFKHLTVDFVIPAGPHAGEYAVEGAVAAKLRTAEEGVEVEYPEAPLPESSLTVNGVPAVFEGTEREKLTGGGTLGFGVLNQTSEPLTYYECVKSKVKGGGGYLDKKCSEEVDQSPVLGSYELRAGAGKGKAFVGKGKAATLHVPAGKPPRTVTCKASADVGTADAGTPATWSKVVATLTGCTSESQSCTSAAAPVGTIVTSALKGTLGYLSKESHEVGVDLSPEAGMDLAVFSCGGLEFDVAGSVIADQTGDINAFSKSSSEVFAVTGEGLQSVTSFEGGPPDVLETTVGGSGPFTSGLQATIVNKGEELELKA